MNQEGSVEISLIIATCPGWRLARRGIGFFLPMTGYPDDPIAYDQDARKQSAAVMDCALGGATPLNAAWVSGYNENMAELGKFLLLVGGSIIVLGAVLLFAGRFNLPLGRLPGDVVYRGKNTVVYFPLATSLILSAILSLIFWLIGRSRH